MRRVRTTWSPVIAMGKTQTPDRIEATDSFIDVVFLSDKKAIPTEVKRLFRHRKITFRLVPLNAYAAIHSRPDLIGTVVIDAQGMNVSENPELGRIIESLERDNIGTILLTQQFKRPVRSFSLVPSDASFSMSSSGSISLDELWAQISVNLSQRKKLDTGIAAKPPVMVTSSERLWNNRVADQPPAAATDALVEGLTEQLRLAGLVQRDFLPAKLPNSNDVHWAVTFLPAEWVSGDIYDVARIDEQHIGFYLADAVGHSMPAALLTIFIKQALTMRETTGNTYRIFSPAEVMHNLNLKMAGQKLSGYQFATCCYCLLNVKSRQLTFARAGHPYPILLRPGQPPQQLQTRGSLLGVFENAEFIQQTVQLERGDRLLLYSDGAETLIRRGGNTDEFNFTDELLAIHDSPITQIVDRLNELAAGRKIAPAELDDLTIVGLEIL
jgi:sigma-B regulation protein RsbU (phosphoserine phosphatase)